MPPKRTAAPLAPSAGPGAAGPSVRAVEDAAVEADCGLVTNQSLTEEEVEKFWAPEELVAVEEELQHERAEADCPAAGGASLEPGAKSLLEKDKFEALQLLLSKSEMYTHFLVEQMKAIEAQTDRDASAAAPAGGAGAAGGRGKRGASRAKPAKQPAAGKRTREQAGNLDDADLASDALNAKGLLPLLHADLREYQVKGVKWLISLYQNGINGILADQMGLGKTVQTIGLLSFLKHKGVHGPFLVVGPLSTLTNWVNEFHRFCPDMPALLYHGSPREREVLRRTRLRVGAGGVVPPDFPVVVSSYEIMMADRKHLQRYEWRYLVVDEGHRLKNHDCRLLRELRYLNVQTKLLLTGTPLQNNLAELWSLLHFLMPDIFSSLADFQGWFDTSTAVQDGANQDVAGSEQRSKVISKLHAILKPFVLRRVKADVEIALPRKQEVVLYADMTEHQKRLNQGLLEGTLAAELTKLAQQDGGGQLPAGRLNNMLMQMRKICNHPDLLTSAYSTDADYPPAEQLVAQCGKMRLLDRLLQQLHAHGHKVLIFSQMTSVLDLLESYLEQQGHSPVRIDGSMAWQARQQAITNFNEDPATWAFLLSTRAGGLGINLTAADTVIIYDSDWNPHQDLQAMDRCHRIGQQKPVLVFRLATANSVEGRMLRRAASKMALERLVIKKGAFKEINNQDLAPGGAQSMSAAELLEVLRADFMADDVPQSGVVDDAMLRRLLDRTHLAEGKALPYALSGVGYEVVQNANESTMLQNIS